MGRLPHAYGFIFKVPRKGSSHRERPASCELLRENSRRSRVNHYASARPSAQRRSFFGQEREAVDEAWAGDVIGLFDPGLYRIGDSLATGGPISFDTVPRFSPEHFARLRLRDPMKRKQLQKGIDQLAEEGTVQVFTEKGREKTRSWGIVRLQF